jgi:hypothetical protein
MVKKRRNLVSSFANQARAQDVSDVLDPTYLPITPADVDLFQETNYSGI